MPTYEYQCEECQHKFEEFQSITADPIDECPECGGKAKRLISAGGGLLFKGNGFYTTDYRSKNYQEKAKSESSGGSDSGSTTSSSNSSDSSSSSSGSTSSSSSDSSSSSSSSD